MMKEEEKKKKRDETLTFPNVMHFLQVEWRNFERERNEWEIDKADLKAKIAFLEGERRGMENIKTDLMRRVKMLEYSLRKERSKYLNLQPSGSQPNNELLLKAIGPPPSGGSSDNHSSNESLTLAENSVQSNNSKFLAASNYAALNALTSNTAGTLLNFSKGFGHMRSREILKGYLSEVGYLLSTSAASVANAYTNAVFPPTESTTDGTTDGYQGDPNADETTAGSIISKIVSFTTGGGVAAVTKTETDQGNKTKNGKENEAGPFSDGASDSPLYQSKDSDSSNHTTLSHIPEKLLKKVVGKYANEDSTEDLRSIALEQEEVVDNVDKKKKVKRKGSALSFESDKKNGKVEYQSLRGHLDSVRCISFHPTELAIVSGSEDHTVKVWNVPQEQKTFPKQISPIHTFRGHTAPVTSVSISNDGSKLFSAGADSNIISWKFPELDRDINSPYDPNMKLHVFEGHSDIVWDIRCNPLLPILASVSSDSTLKIWDTGDDSPGLKESIRFDDDVIDNMPICLSWMPSEVKKIFVGLQNGMIKLFDVETGSEILSIENQSVQGAKPQINSIVCHKTKPILISGGEDRFIRFFDINSGKCTNSIAAHSDSVTSLDINPHSSVLVSGGHDCSIRWWDLATNNIVQEFTSHRKKNDEGIWGVAFHPDSLSNEISASCGSDSTVKIY